MLYYLSQRLLESAAGTPWARHLSPLRLFGYITFRSAGAAITALLLSWWLGPRVIAWLRAKFGQEYVDIAGDTGVFQRGAKKKGTPTMGGVLIVLSLNLSTLLWTHWNSLVELTLLSVVVLTALGFYDDYAKIIHQSGRKGTKSRVKLWVQGALALFIGVYLWLAPSTRQLVTDIMVPFYKSPIVRDAIILGLVLTLLTIVGSSNAVNLTDGMDGLAIGCTLIVSFVFVVLTYLAGNSRAAGYLQIPYVPGAGELTVICAAMIGAGLGFLWFNCPPAQVFMGDTGSLPLGGLLGIIAVLIHQPLVLIIAGGVFVIEAGSVILQTGWFRYTRLRRGVGQRIFLMAPIHHHFEKKGWDESQVVMRFYILGVLCAVMALSTLKIR
ncbi:MAG: phospho-N-acetylmuramoyl-pentapeptide-transferase [Verrucomicrobia bacterium]|nr:MAG: phospho-N-acetylmuramoyl-pentapeptide-transferase [Verrucomicrobiota bacterium]